MEITWYGHSCFRLTERGIAAVVTDPYDHREVGYSPLALKADIITISHQAPGHNYLPGVIGKPFIISGPGEYERGGVFITGVQTDHLTARNTLYVFNFNNLAIAHLGNLNRVPDQAEVEQLGTINVALVPVGGLNSLNASKAAEVISLLEPNIVIPMHYANPASPLKLDPLSKFLKEMGLTETITLPSYTIPANLESLPGETQVVVLDYQMC
jgi:L-ascorbate metabolism protein UlaG (beta-lactamase superfamily)